MLEDTSHNGNRHARGLQPWLALIDSAAIDRVVLGQAPAHLIAGDPWATTVVRRIGESRLVRDYLATFAKCEEGARRVLGVSLALARMAGHEGEPAAAALAVGAWCAAALGRWSFANLLARHAVKAVDGYSLAELIIEGVEKVKFDECVGIEPTITAELVRECAEQTLERIRPSRTFVI